MAMIDMTELESVLNEVLSPKSETQTSVPEPEPEVVENTLEPTDWEAHPDYEGVEWREISARELFNEVSLPNVLIKQYRGFDNTLPVPSIYAPHLASLTTIIKSEITGLKALLVGDTGCGKTSLLEYYAAVTGRPFFRVVWDESTDDQKLFGSLEVRTGESGTETYFNPSPLTRSMAYPSLVVMDELSAGTSGQTMLVNPLLDRRQITITTHDESASQVITAVDDWLVFATDNTAGNGDDLDLYNSRNILDQAIINRFDLYQKVPYAPESTERQLIHLFSEGAVDAEDGKKLAHFSAQCHKGFSDRTITTAFSVRNLMAICALVKAGDSVKEAIKLNYWARVAKSEQPDIAEMVRSIFG